MLTKESNEFIKELKHKMKTKDLLEDTYLKRLFHKLEANAFDYDIPKITRKKTTFPKNNFMVPHLQRKAKEYTNVRCVTWQIMSKHSVNCSLNVYTKTKELTDSNLNLLIYAISFILSLSNRDKKITIHLVLLPDKKKYNGKFTKREINGGFCSYNEKEAEIYVWRAEECVKVLFHECIHGLNFSLIQDSKDIVDKYNRLYNNSSPQMEINETYTEIWAKLLNCYFISKISAQQYEDLDTYKYFCSLLAIERNFCIQQGVKVATQLKQNKKKIDVNNDTHVIAYYIATAEVFNNLANFLRFCFRDDKPFYLKDQRLFNSFLLECKKIPIRKLNTKSKGYATMRMTSMELKVM